MQGTIHAFDKMKFNRSTRLGLLPAIPSFAAPPLVWLPLTVLKTIFTDSLHQMVVGSDPDSGWAAVPFASLETSNIQINAEVYGARFSQIL